MEPGQVFAAVGPAAGLSLTALLLVHQPWRREPRLEARWRAAIGALAVAAAFVLAAICLGYWRGFWPRGAHERIPLVAMIVGVAEAAVCLAGRPAVRLGVRAAAAIAVAWILGSPLLGGASAPIRLALWMPVLSGTVFVWWVLVDGLAANERGALLPLMLWLTATAASMLLLFGAHFLSQSHLAAAVAAAAGALVACAWWQPAIKTTGLAGVIAALLACGLMLGYLAQSLPLWMVALTVLVPFSVLIRRLPPIARLRPWAAALACFLAGVILVAPPILVAIRAYMASPY